MGTRTIGYASKLLFLLVLCLPVVRAHTNQVVEKEGRLVVTVTYGDVDNTPARNVHIYVHGYLPKYPDSEKSIVLKAARVGQYEASLPQGIYDILVSDAGSLPRSRRVEIKPDKSEFWTLKLEFDDDHLEK